MLEYLNNWYANSREFSLEERLLSQLRIVVKYIYWFFVPNIQNFGLYHDDFQISKSFLNPPTIILCLIFLLSMTALAFAVAKKRPLLSFGITWFFIGHLIESTVIPLEMIYEHRNYLSFIGLSIAATDIAVMLIEKFQKISKIVFITGMLICCIFAGLTYARSGHWSTPFSFAYFEALHHPNSNRANHALGMIYRSLVLNGETKFKSDAYRYLKKASKIDSAFIQSEVALLQFSFEQKDPASPEWIDSIASKLNTKIIRSDYVNLLDQMLQCKNELCFLPKDARGTLIDAAYTNPRLHIRPILHAKVLSIRANYLLNSGGNIQEAENNLQSAIMLNPNDIQNYADYINLLLLKDQPKLALKIIDDAYNADKNNTHKTELDMLKNNIIQNIN